MPRTGRGIRSPGRISALRGFHGTPRSRGAPKGLRTVEKPPCGRRALRYGAKTESSPFCRNRSASSHHRPGAAVRDILQILGRRFPNLHVLIRPTLVQGAEAAGQIVKAIEELNSISGTGTDRPRSREEDPWRTFGPSTKKPVARAVFESRLPVVSAVGHEIDFTIADFTADLRAPTPSAAAELIVPQKADLEREIKRLDEGLVRAVGKRPQKPPGQPRRTGLQTSGSETPFGGKKTPAGRSAQPAGGFHGRIIDGSRKTVAHQQALFVIGIKALKPETARSEIDGLSQRLARGMRNTVDRNRTALQHIATLMNTVGPLNVLARGYSITRKLPEGVIVGDASILSKGDRIAVTFSKGDAECTVDKTKKRRDRNNKGKGPEPEAPHDFKAGSPPSPVKKLLSLRNLPAPRPYAVRRRRYTNCRRVPPDAERRRFPK